jgi:hypothetical protein
MTKTGKGRPRGRPPVSADEKKDRNFTFRSRGDMHERLSNAAALNRHSISEEIEYRLERSFFQQETLIEALELHYGRDLAGLLQIMGDAMLVAGQEAGFRVTRTLKGAKNWRHSAFAFAQAKKSANIVLDELAPSGDPAPPPNVAPIQTIGDELPPEFSDALQQPDNIARGVVAAIFEEAATGQTRSGSNVDRARRLHRAGAPFADRLAAFASPEFRDALSHIGDDQ